MDLTYRLANGLGRGVLAALGVQVRVHGLEHLPRTGPVVVASTHGSYLDFIVLEKAAIARGRRLRYLIRHDMWAPGLGLALDGMRHVPVDRAAPAAAYLRARSLLRQGRSIGIFPEAGISYGFTVRGLMPGAAALARATGAPIVPAAIWGAQRITTVGDPEPKPDLARGRVVDVQLAPPMHVPPYEDPRAATERLGPVLAAMLEGLQRLPHHRPRPGEHAPWHPAHLGGHAPTLARARELDVLPVGAVTPTWAPGGGPASG